MLLLLLLLPLSVQVQLKELTQQHCYVNPDAAVAW